MKVPFIIYLVEVLDKISCLLTLIVVVSVIGMLISLIVISFNDDMEKYGDEYKRKKESAKETLKSIFMVFCVCSFFSILIPSKNTIYLMIGGYASESIYESDEAKAFGNRILNIVNSKLDELEKPTKEKK